MNKKLNLVKEKLPKRRRKKNDDDDNLFLKGMYSDYLETKGYDVEETINNNREKGTQVDFPEIKGVGCLFDSKVKDYKSLLEKRRDKMTQTFRYMMVYAKTKRNTL